MRLFWTAILVTSLLAGCATTENEDPLDTDAETPTPAPGPLDAIGLTVNHTTDGDEQVLDIEGKMPAGSAWFLFWPFDGLQDGYGASYSLQMDACDGAVDGTWALLARPQPVEGDADLELWFAADFRLLEAGLSSTGGGSAGGTSAGDLHGMITALVVDEAACIDLKLSFSDSFGNQTPEFRAGNATFSEFVINDPAPGTAPVTMDIQDAGWQHVHRRPHCATGLDEAPFVNAPKELVKADIAFPNGYTANAGVYLNGIFPGPTPSDAMWFGTFPGEAGTLSIDITSPWPGECVVAIATDLEIPEFGAGSGYIDQFSESVLLPGAWDEAWPRSA